MEAIKTILSKPEWAELSTSINPEPYILTPDEEAAAIEYELAQKRKHAAYKLALTRMPESEIVSRVKAMSIKIDEEAVLRRANSNKHRVADERVNREEEALKRAKKAQELKDYWTAGRFLQLMRGVSEKKFGKKLIENVDTLPLIKTLCLFFSKDPRFETELKLDLNKGLLLRGVSGLGKTHLVECLAINELNPVKVLSLIEITDEVKNSGEYAVQMDGCQTLYLDDVGTETTPVKYYGTEVNWFKDFLELYYSKKLPFNKLLLSMNLNHQGVEDKYGFRVRSRVMDMFNIINVTGKDLRG